MAAEQRFILANGYCHVLPYHIVISTDDNPNELLRRKEKNTMPVMVFFQLLTAVGFFFGGSYFINDGKIQEGIIFFVIGTVGLFFFFRMRKYSNVRVILRSQIRNIQLKKVMFNPTFVILFKNSKNKFNERLLVMKANDLKEIDKAIKIFRSENLMSRQSINNAKSTVEISVKESALENKSAVTIQNSVPKTESKSTETKYKRDAGGYLKDY